MDSMIRQVYVSLKEDSRKGDFVSLTNGDREELEIEFLDEDIEEISKKN